jgi:hypothetical protein
LRIDYFHLLKNALNAPSLLSVTEISHDAPKGATEIVTKVSRLWQEHGDCLIRKHSVLFQGFDKEEEFSLVLSDPCRERIERFLQPLSQNSLLLDAASTPPTPFARNALNHGPFICSTALTKNAHKSVAVLSH